MPVKNAAVSEETRSISATRVFDAPPDRVFDMWSDAKHLAKWWGPRGFTITTHEFSFKPGGRWSFVMHGPDKRDYKNEIVFREINRPHRIAYSHVSTPPFEAEATFINRNGKTEVTMKGTWETAELRDRVAKQFNAIQGMQETLDRLGEAAAYGDEAFEISRTFDAPRSLVWKAWTEPDRLAQWFGPKGAKVVHSNNDLRPGGVYHYGMEMEGNRIWGKWVYREISEPHRLVFISSFSDENGGIGRHPMSADWPRETLSTILFDEKNGKTTVTVKWVPINATDIERKTFREAKPSMTGGWGGTLASLESYLAEVQR
ncbi:MAG TPA: SRPBCC family protein [Thermoanaerobaculia bacterium]|nr:SRPBCC family protein [Thermoanaerobaculia bacterium]